MRILNSKEKSLMREIKQPPLLYRLLRRVPTPARLLLVYLTAPKMTVGASAIIWNPSGQVLLVHHTYRRPAWGFPSGLVGRNEDPGAALERELREELGVLAKADILLHAETHASARHLTLYYQVSLQGTPRHDGVEIDALRYVALQDLEAVFGTRPAAWLQAARLRHTS